MADPSQRTHSNKFDTTKRPPIVSEVQQNTAAAHSSGRSRVQIANLANIAVYVVPRIVLVPLSGKHLANSNLRPARNWGYRLSVLSPKKGCRTMGGVM
jgi:hypothetical protein